MSIFNKISCLFKSQEWNDVLLKKFKHPSEICKIVRNNITYKNLNKTWRKPEAVWKSKYGNCKDYAICISEICRKNNFISSIYIFFEKNSNTNGHAINVGEANEQGKIWIANNGFYKEVNSIKEIDEIVAKTLGCKKENLFSFVLHKYFN